MATWRTRVSHDPGLAMTRRANVLVSVSNTSTCVACTHVVPTAPVTVRREEVDVRFTKNRYMVLTIQDKRELLKPL